MISFLLLTNDAADMATKLIARGILNAEGGAKDGFEYVEVGPIKVTEATVDDEGVTIPATFDPRRVFLCKFAGDLEVDETAGEDAADADDNPRDMMLRTKLGKFAASKKRDDLPDGTPAWRIGLIGKKLWVVPEHAHIASWQ